MNDDVTVLRCRLCPDWEISDLVVDRLFNRVATHFRFKHGRLRWNEHVERRVESRADAIARGQSRTQEAAR